MYIFELHGPPIPQQQTRFFKAGSGIRTYDPSSKSKTMLQWQMKPYAPRDPLPGALKVDLTFYFPVPKSTSGIKRRQMLNHVICHTKKPDLDNCAYLITNAMKKIFYNDDNQIVDLYIHKRYGEEPKTVVKVIPIEEIAHTRGDDIDP